MRATALRIMAVGLRGMPHVEGGIETHAAELYPRLAKLGADVIVLGRRRCRPDGVGNDWGGVRLRWLWSPRVRGVEAAVHTLFGVLYAGVRRPDVLHIHAVGPSITVPIAKLLGLRVVVTHHGQDYLREKWTKPEQAVIRLGERFAVRYSDRMIAISSNLRGLIRTRYGREISWIPNGVANHPIAEKHTLAERYQLPRGRYVIQVSRLVPEKRQLDLIKAFQAAQLPGWKLVLVGSGQSSSQYAASVKEAAANDVAIVCTGVLSAPEVHELLSDAGIFVLPSSHEGLPIALLEAIACGLPSLASDIPGNREIGLNTDSYFTLGDTTALAARLQVLASSSESRTTAIQRYAEICERFDWSQIAQATIRVMEEAARSRRHAPVPSAETVTVDPDVGETAASEL